MAGEFKSLTVVIEGDTTKFRRDMKRASEAVKGTQSELRKLNNAAKLDPSSLGLMRTRAEQLDTTMYSLYHSLDRTKKSMRGMDGALKGAGTDMRRIRTDIARVGEAFNDANEKLETYHRKLRELQASNSTDGKSTYDKDDPLWEIQARKILADEYRLKGGNGFIQSLDQIDEYINNVRRAKEEQKGFQNQLDRLKEATNFTKLVSESEHLKAQIHDLANESVKLKKSLNDAKIGNGALSGSRRGLSAYESEASRLSSVYDGIGKSMSNDPSIGKAAAQFALLKDEEMLATKELDALRRGMKEIGRTHHIDGVADSTAELDAKMEKAEKKSANLTKALAMARQRAHDLDAELKKAKNDGDDVRVSELEKDIARANRQLAKGEAKLESVDAELEQIQARHAFKTMENDAKKVDARLSDVDAKLKSFGRWRGGSGLVTLGRTISETLTPMMYMMGYGAVDAADEIDSAYRDMRKTVNGTEKDFEALKDAAVEYSRTTIVPAEQILEIEAMGGQLGVQVSALESYADTVSNLDTATNIDADTLAEQLGKIGSVLGMDEDDYGKFGDALVRLGNNFPALESDITEIVTRFVGMGKVVGMGGDQMLAWATAATATGQKAESAGSAMQRFISNLETAATNADDSWAKVAGYDSGEQLKKAFGEDASKVMYDFISGLGEMQRSGKSVNQQLKALGINNVRDKQLMEGFANQMANGTEEANLLRRALEASSTAWNGETWVDASGNIVEAGDAAREAAKKCEGLSGSLKKMQNVGAAAATDIGDAVSPIMAGMADSAADLERAFETLPDGVKVATVGLLGAAIAAGPFINLAGGIKQSYLSLAGPAAKAAKYQNMVNKAFSAGKISEEMLESIVSGSKAFNDLDKGQQRVIRSSARTVTAMNAVKGAARGIAAISAAGLGVAAVSAVAGGIADAVEKYRTLKTATDGLTKSMEGFGASSKAAASVSSGSTRSIAESIEELVGAQAQLADEQRKAFEDTGTKMNMLDEYGQAIKENIGDDSSDSISKLKVAVGGLNSILGTDYSVTKSGFIKGLGKDAEKAKGKVDDLIGAQKRLMLIEAFSDAAKKATEQRINNQQKLVEAERELADAKAALRKLDESGNTDSGLRYSAESRVADAQKAVDEAKKIRDASVESGNYITQALEFITKANEEGAKGIYKEVASDAELVTSIASSGFDVTAIVDGFDRLGFSAEQLRDVDLASVFQDMRAAGVGLDDTSAIDAYFQAAIIGAENAETALKQLDEFDPHISVKWDEDKKGFRTVKQDVKLTDGTKVHIEAGMDASEVDEKIEKIKKDKNLDGNVTIKANANDAKRNIIDIRSMLNRLDGKVANVKVIETTVKKTKAASSSGRQSNPMNARGGIFVPNRRFASGGIVSRPVYTGHGLVGEAGTEAIIPLSNKRYVKPFANAVASQMASKSVSQHVTKNYYSIGNVSAPDGSATANAVKQLYRAIRMEQRS